MATLGQWQGVWQGDWFGPTEEAPPGSMSGSASFSISAAGTLTAGGDGFMTGAASFSINATGNLTASGSIIDTILGGGSDRHWGERQQAAWLHEQRIKRQNDIVLAVVMAAVTEGML